MPATKRADVWVLLGPHRGDNHQVLALAEGLGVPFRPIQMRYHWFAHLPAVLRSVAISAWNSLQVPISGPCRTSRDREGS